MSDKNRCAFDDMLRVVHDKLEHPVIEVEGVFIATVSAEGGFSWSIHTVDDDARERLRALIYNVGQPNDEGDSQQPQESMT